MRTAENREPGTGNGCGARCIGEDPMLLDEFVRRKAEVFFQCRHPLAGTGHRSALIGRLVAEQMAKEHVEAGGVAT